MPKPTTQYVHPHPEEEVKLSQLERSVEVGVGRVREWVRQQQEAREGSRDRLLARGTRWGKGQRGKTRGKQMGESNPIKTPAEVYPRKDQGKENMRGAAATARAGAGSGKNKAPKLRKPVKVAAPSGKGRLAREQRAG